jgi:hypothetical protein
MDRLRTPGSALLACYIESEMFVDEPLVMAAIELATARYAGDPDGFGWAGAAAMYSAGGEILTSV